MKSGSKIDSRAALQSDRKTIREQPYKVRNKKQEV